MFRRRRIELGQMPDTTLKTLRCLSDEDLHKWIAGWKENTDCWIRGQVELRRRENWTARAALTVSIVAIVIAAINAIFSC